MAQLQELPGGFRQIGPGQGLGHSFLVQRLHLDAIAGQPLGRGGHLLDGAHRAVGQPAHLIGGGVLQPGDLLHHAQGHRHVGVDAPGIDGLVELPDAQLKRRQLRQRPG